MVARGGPLREVVKAGDEITVKVLRVDEDKQKNLAPSLKQLTDAPPPTVARRRSGPGIARERWRMRGSQPNGAEGGSRRRLRMRLPDELRGALKPREKYDEMARRCRSFVIASVGRSSGSGVDSGQEASRKSS